MPIPPPTGPRSRFFYDCEFIEDGRTIELVSIGVVSDDGREYYAVSTDFDPAQANSWVAANVLPLLPRPADQAWRSKRKIRDELYEMFTATGLPIELWAWNAAYDHVVLAQLWGDMRCLPPQLPRFTYEIRQHWIAANCPALPGLGPDRHNALTDARAGYQRFLAIEQARATDR